MFNQEIPYNTSAEEKKNREHRASRGPRGPFGTRSGILNFNFDFNFVIILT